MDLDCFDDMTAFADELNDPLAELEQDLWHRLIEEPGSNIDDPDRGFGLFSRLSGVYDPATPQLIEAEMRKDDRVVAARCTVAELEDGVFRVDIQIETDAGDVAVTANVTSSGVERVT